jgi:hypothetical protein
LLALVAVSNDAFAWKETGGGDEVALEFRQAFAASLRTIKEGRIRGKFSVGDLERAVEKANLVVVDEPLTVRFQDLTQESVAVNEPANWLIKINRGRWNSLKSAKLQEAIALHEVLSLIGIERTGYYEVSARYLEEAGLSGWLVSGHGEERVEKPAAKTLNCEVTLLPFDGRYEDEERLTVKEVLKENGPRTAWALESRKSLMSKNGRFRIDVWALQPFRTAYNPSAYEYVGINLLDVQRGTTTTTGPTSPRMAEQNESFARLSHSTGPSGGGPMMIGAKCSLN